MALAASRGPRGRRRTLSDALAATVMAQSRHRCALCFGLEGDDAQKEGQIAHLNRNRTDDRPANLAFLCLPHAGAYDRRSTQERGFSPPEVRLYLGELYAHLRIKRLGLLPSRVSKQNKLRPRPARTWSLPLYERRLKIYHAWIAFIRKAVQDASVDLNDIAGLHKATDEALFLFDQTVDDYSTLVARQAIKLRHTNQILRDQGVRDQRWNDASEENIALLLWFGEQMVAVRHLVHPFLAPA